jgi:hypothetical protein
MATLNQKLIARIGAPFQLRFRYLDTNKNPVDLSGWKSIFQARRSVNSESLLSLSSIGSNPTISMGTDGYIVLDSFVSNTVCAVTNVPFEFWLTPPITEGDEFMALTGKIDFVERIAYLP